MSSSLGQALPADWRQLCSPKAVCACWCLMRVCLPGRRVVCCSRVPGHLAWRLSMLERLNLLSPAHFPKARKLLRVTLGRWRQPVQSQCYAWQWAPTAFVDDRECPYTTTPDRPFVWVRARKLGGRVAVPGHGRQYYRLGPDDFAPPDGLSEQWPLKPKELDPWYALVERRLGMSGMYDGLPWLPDSELANVLSPRNQKLSSRIG